VADLRRDMTKREIINSLAFTDGAPAVLEKRLHLYRNEKRVATITVIPVDEALDVGVPDDGTIAQIHQGQAERYTAPERRSASFILLTAERAMKDVTVTEEELRSRYEENLASYTTPEKRTVQQIPFSDEESARKAAGMIGEGRTFEAVPLRGSARADRKPTEERTGRRTALRHVHDVGGRARRRRHAGGRSRGAGCRDRKNGSCRYRRHGPGRQAG
jgi:acyl-CoA synthetase (AMP-forming)/AMP-acid ligase II